MNTFIDLKMIEVSQEQDVDQCRKFLIHQNPLQQEIAPVVASPADHYQPKSSEIIWDSDALTLLETPQTLEARTDNIGSIVGEATEKSQSGVFTINNEDQFKSEVLRFSNTTEWLDDIIQQLHEDVLKPRRELAIHR